MLVREGGGASISCLYSDSVGAKRQVDWYRNGSMISGTVEGCCRSERRGYRNDLIFSDFTSNSTGEYGCWATVTPGIFDRCSFNVEIVGMGSYFTSKTD